MNKPTDEHQAESAKIFQPILDLAAGSDGGVAFSTLRHGLLPKMIADAEAGDHYAAEVVARIRQVSNLFAAALEGKLR